MVSFLGAIALLRKCSGFWGEFPREVRIDLPLGTLWINNYVFFPRMAISRVKPMEAMAYILHGALPFRPCQSPSRGFTLPRGVKDRYSEPIPWLNRFGAIALP